jgi:hypothetical protein
MDDSDMTTKMTSSSLREEAEILKAKAEKLRSEIEKNEQENRRRILNRTAGVEAADIDDVDYTKTSSKPSTSTSKPVISSPWSVVHDGEDEYGERYRLYVDVGREEGTWMDPRWGASGKRIPFTIDVKFLSNQLAEEVVADKMVKDNTMGISSPAYVLKTAEFARLRDGFDRMRVYGGAYRIDVINGRYTMRMMIDVDGTTADQNYVYGDVSIPKGPLYFSIPCFGGRLDQLSTKDGPVTVRQNGWHTGWRRMESRIVGVFNAKPTAEARKKDSY